MVRTGGDIPGAKEPPRISSLLGPISLPILPTESLELIATAAEHSNAAIRKMVSGPSSPAFP